ncbi:hypothetical protein F383_23635 [Gossypium arboreum]|uniref:Uncharacterized protein n=1 Tax=Gossypium arboreum TaxID=29729 RepID=A0A0B0MLU6_GOSAR|nr:hypothetical protein F383_23635 [Gossypium arboreum]
MLLLVNHKSMPTS